ncbi:MAG: response regulator [Gemmatimonas sp.]|nr:response regulator [Gemmatimonas sp.]
MRALIIEDERLARSELRRLLSQHPEVEIVGEAQNATEARRAIDDLEPDLLFLDVQMPGESGFELLASLEAVPLVVFTTAYDEYALRAFEVSALDYLVKPIDPKRLAGTVERLMAAWRAGSASSLPGESSPDHANAPLSPHDRVFVTEGERSWLVELGTIRLFESEGNYTRVFFGKEKPLINRSLNQLEARLDERVFFRANRSQIINLKAVCGIHPWFGGRLMAELENGQEVTLSRRRARAFRELMSV